MKIFLNRNSVCAGDDTDTHEKTVDVTDGLLSLEEILVAVAPRYLPTIAGGQATWIVTSRVPIAVMAQQWNKSPKMLPPASLYDSALVALRCNSGDQVLAVKKGVLQLYFRYCTQKDPDQILKELS